MNLILMRKERRPDGIFSELTDELGTLIAHTLEHAYPVGTAWEPKIPNGGFICRRGEHRLHGMRYSFSTFEIMDVPGHTGILFHWGNYNRDSEGCVLLGDCLARVGASQIVGNSRATFARFMEMQAGTDEFQLTVQG